MGASLPKQYLPLSGQPIACYSFVLLSRLTSIDSIVVVCEEEYETLFEGAIFARPGPRRQDSLAKGLEKAPSDTDLILVHDAARPLIAEEDVLRVIDAAKIHGAATLATPVKATIKEGDPNQMVTKTLKRSTLFEIQTPQVVRKEILQEGLAHANENNLTVTDDVSLAELLLKPTKLVEGSNDNIKITTPEDLAFAQYILDERALVH
ncbi:MAG: 2-C-methyl-D-erythritol 4-phosphate cytidylyltransferase [Chlamydiae bacterium]|nr:2-C-methyl-D-erythritol 4-phosphate cytidylyltransferase [Chlamydiota bacterium]